MVARVGAVGCCMVKVLLVSSSNSSLELSGGSRGGSGGFQGVRLNSLLNILSK